MISPVDGQFPADQFRQQFVEGVGQALLPFRGSGQWHEPHDEPSPSSSSFSSHAPTDPFEKSHRT
jgi:hypothetical protein